jgi:hypothetical protein
VVLLFPADDWATIGQQSSRFRMESLIIEARKAHGKSRVTNRPNELFVVAPPNFSTMLTALTD